MAGTSTPKYHIWINVGFWVKWIRHDIPYQVCSTNVLYQKPGFRFWSAKVEHLTQENLDVISYAWENLLLPEMAGSSSDWQMGTLGRLNCTVFMDSLNPLCPQACSALDLDNNGRPFCDVPSVGCPVLWQMGSRGWHVEWMDSSVRALPVVHQLLHHPAPKEWGILQEVSCIGSWPVSFGTALALSDYIVSD